MTRIRRTALFIVGALLATVAVACGSSGSGGGNGSGVSAPPNTVIIKNFTFNPQTLSVKLGTKVTFTNEDSTGHTATGTGSSASIKSPTLNNGQSYTVTFTKRGTYQYVCSIHPYMKGTITVT